MLKLSFTTLGCPGWTLRQIAENAAKMGYDAVDLRGLLEDVDISKRPEFTTGLNETKQLFADHGIAISGIAISARYAVVDAAEKEKHFNETRRNMELAAKLGAHILRVYGGSVPEGHTVDSIMPTVVENLRQIADEAEQYEITLALETHDDWCDPVNIRALQERVGDGFGVVWDFANAIRVTGKGIAEQFEGLKGSVLYCHVKDWTTDADGKSHYVPVGTGDAPVREVVRLLKANNLNVFLSFEHEKMWHPELPDPEEALPAYVKFMRSIL